MEGKQGRGERKIIDIRTGTSADIENRLKEEVNMIKRTFSNTTSNSRMRCRRHLFDCAFLGIWRCCVRGAVVLVLEDGKLVIPLYVANSDVLFFSGFVPNEENPIAAATIESSGLSSMMSEFVRRVWMCNYVSKRRQHKQR